MGGGGESKVRELEPVGPGSAVLFCTAYGALAVGGPVALVSILRKFGDHRAIALVLGIGAMLFLLWAGVLGLLDSWERRRLTKLLTATGVAATARVLSVGPTVPGGEAESDTVHIGVRISGPGFDPFEVGCVRPLDSRPALGADIAVLIHPAEKLFSFVA